ncbi:hypothetical protein LB554_05975 [Mesorhizobium sp. CO1-1-11]|uniref:hypothetical protein n=1 Tax=Mesorhizobium sp. CO1-1-11 TaxID=2876636 RepID=UPI001CCD9333|nr:hypothetical protein [Mesorhizobium sp. CO1-1-11]MBZ9723490.1 hypothetical protein [Mesorhizobium sp. CO1-1-11]
MSRKTPRLPNLLRRVRVLKMTVRRMSNADKDFALWRCESLPPLNPRKVPDLGSGESFSAHALGDSRFDKSL